MTEYYDRQGNAMTMMEWAQSFETRSDQKRVAETTLPNGRWVSTVWLGLDHSFGNGPPLIFETMVFSGRGDMSDLDCDRYSTEAEAVAGHARMVEKWSVEEPEAADAVARTATDPHEPPTRDKSSSSLVATPTDTES